MAQTGGLGGQGKMPHNDIEVCYWFNVTAGARVFVWLQRGRGLQEADCEIVVQKMREKGCD